MIDQLKHWWKHRNRKRSWLYVKLILSIYLLIASVVLMKNSIGQLVEDQALTFLEEMFNPLTAFFTSWFFSIIMQSATIIAIIIITLLGFESIPQNIAVYAFLGLFLGNSISSIFASLVIKVDKKWDLRHGFELAFANTVYSFFLFLLAITLQISTGVFSTIGNMLQDSIVKVQFLKYIPSLVDVLVYPVISIFQIINIHPIIILIIVIGALVYAFNTFDDSVTRFLKRKSIMTKLQEHLNSDYKIFTFSLGLGIILPSSSLLVSMAVPLAMRGVITLRQSIPFIIAVNLATFIDVVLAALANGSPGAISGSIVLMLISMLGFVFCNELVGIPLLYQSTRFFCLKILPMEKHYISAFLFIYTIVPVIGFILVQYFL